MPGAKEKEGQREEVWVPDALGTLGVGEMHAVGEREGKREAVVVPEPPLSPNEGLEKRMRRGRGTHSYYPPPMHSQWEMG